MVYTGGLDEPIQRPYIERDWRFGHYQMDGLQDPLSRFLRFTIRSLSLKWKKEPQKKNVKLVLEPLELSS